MSKKNKKKYSKKQWQEQEERLRIVVDENFRMRALLEDTDNLIRAFATDYLKTKYQFTHSGE